MKLNNRKSLVSIIMSEYNTPIETLRLSIESILRQDYDNLELIIIDDYSVNDVRKIVDHYDDSRIKVYRNKRNMGLIYSLNKAINKCNGEYIARMDTDDIALSNRIRLQLSFIKEHPDIDLIGAQAKYYDDDGEWGMSKVPGGIITRNHLINGNPIIHPTIFARKSFFKNNLYPNYDRCEDYALWIKSFLCGKKLYNMKIPVINYHLGLKDYKKRKLKTRKGYLRLLGNEYKDLNPSCYEYVKLLFKTIVMGIIPGRIAYKYQRRKYCRKNKQK